MNTYFFDISFPNINFNKYIKDTNKFPESIKAELVISSEKIVLNLFIKEFNLNIESKLFYWIGETSASTFGKEIEIKSINENDILKIDFTDSNILSAKSRSQKNITSIYFDTIKIYQHSELSENKAYVYLCENGFNFIKQFYGSFYHKDEDSVFKLTKIFDDVYKGYNCNFYPHFSYDYTSEKNSPKIEIIKQPYFNFDFIDVKDENDANKIILSILSSCSFFMQQKIEIKTSTIHLKNTRTITYNIIDYPSKKSDGNLMNFGVRGSANNFLSINWQKNAYENFNKLNKVIELFNQSLFPIGQRTIFLIRFNILEICKTELKLKNEKFSFKNEKVNFNIALELLLSSLPENEKDSFTNKWDSISGSIKYKSINNTLKAFLSNKGIPLDNLPITFKDFIMMRNDITHGSGDIDKDKLTDINILLYRITGILILDLLGINNWKLDLSLPKRKPNL